MEGWEWRVNWKWVLIFVSSRKDIHRAADGHQTVIPHLMRELKPTFPWNSVSSVVTIQLTRKVSFWVYEVLDYVNSEGHPPRSRRSSDRHPALDAGTKATSIAVHQFPAQGRYSEISVICRFYLCIRIRNPIFTNIYSQVSQVRNLQELKKLKEVIAHQGGLRS